MFANRPQINYVNRQIFKQNITMGMCAHAWGGVEVIFYLHEWWCLCRTGATLWHMLPSWISGSSEFLSYSSNSESPLFKCGWLKAMWICFHKAWRLISVHLPFLTSLTILMPSLANNASKMAVSSSVLNVEWREESWLCVLAMIIAPRTVWSLSEIGLFKIWLHRSSPHFSESWFS